jgi:D-alanyl-lipoteichoic acid acyltransferase DltB (MBOAT superfamily)
MLFNSIDFAVFFSAVFILYWFVFNRSLRLQNIFLLASNIIFYASYNWRFLPLLIGISFSAYIIGLAIDKAESLRIRKLLLLFGIALCAGVLGIFKYYDFFSEGFILPLGISFYIFLSLSYIIDVYKRVLKAVTDPVEALVALSFFPILLAGPIERPVSLLPAVQKKRRFSYELASGGLRQILWGLFMKILIADNCAVFANEIFNNYSSYNGSTLLAGALFYTVQIYADFAGYSEIAIGVSKLLGIELKRNFAFPYFAGNITEFWRRWHISLTSWFRDYIFLPVSFFISRKIPSEKVLGMNTDILIYAAGMIVTWFLTGLWHGSNYTYILWGSCHGALLFLYHIQKKPRKILLKKLKIKHNNIFIVTFERLFTILAVTLFWIIFRSENISQSAAYISEIFSISVFSKPEFAGIRRINPVLIFTAVLFLIEWKGKNSSFALEKFGMKTGRIFRWSFYTLLILSIYFFGNFSSAIEFIYFQF